MAYPSKQSRPESADLPFLAHGEPQREEDPPGLDRLPGAHGQQEQARPPDESAHRHDDGFGDGFVEDTGRRRPTPELRHVHSKWYPVLWYIDCCRPAGREQPGCMEHSESVADVRSLREGPTLPYMTCHNGRLAIPSWRVMYDESITADQRRTRVSAARWRFGGY